MDKQITMVETLLASCNARFINDRHGKSCNKCTYAGHCPDAYNACERCLELVHFPSRTTKGAPIRKYDCTCMADFYVCKYTHKYVSELIHIFSRLKDLKPKENIKILSFGCGPCTDLLALNYLCEMREYNYKTLEYHGIDYNKDVWGNIHGDIKCMQPSGNEIKFFYEDARTIVDKIAGGKWVPDLVVFQYFFSDMNKNSESGEISSFVSKFAHYANSKMPINSYIVMNDINLSTSYGGGREYFDKLLTMMNNANHVKGHFHNKTRPKTYGYGSKYDN